MAGADWGNQYGKPDMERLGLFTEMPFLTGKYITPKQVLVKGRNMIPGGPKWKTGKQDCYFDTEFKRLFIGEALKGRGRKPKPPRFKNVSNRPFMPPGYPKHHATPGDWHGTFGGKIEAFSNVRRKAPPYVKEKRQCGTSPVKKGGPGYVNICLNKYPEHSTDRYGTPATYKQYGFVLGGPYVAPHFPKPYFYPNPYPDPPNVKPGRVYVKPQEKYVEPIPPGKMIPTGPAKSQGGCHAGCFDLFPEYKPNKYITIWDLTKPRKRTGLLSGEFSPQSMAEKSYYTTSIITENTRFRVHSKNINSYEPTYVKHLLS